MLLFVATIVVCNIIYHSNIVEGIECNTNAISIDLSGIETDWYQELTTYIASLLTDFSESVSEKTTSYVATTDDTCGGYFDTCSLSQFDFTGYVSVDATFINNLPDVDIPIYGEVSISKALDLLSITAEDVADAISFSVNADIQSEFCGNSELCSLFAGGTNSCQKLSYDFSLWIPTTCVASADYNAITLGYDMNYYYACCNTDNCNDASGYNYNNCTDANDQVSFANDLTDCWQDIQVELAIYLFCEVVGDSGSTSNFINNCTDESGDWDAAACTYQLLCTDEFQELLSTFASCACTAATGYGYDADIIAELMETLWSMYCGNINIECGQDGSLDLTLTYWNVDWTFSLDSSGDLSVDSSLQDIISAIATNAGVDESLVEVLDISEYIDNTDQNVTIQIKTDSSSFADSVKSTVSSTTEITTSDETSYTVSSHSVILNTTTEYAATSSGGGSGISGPAYGDTWDLAGSFMASDGGRAFGITVVVLLPILLAVLIAWYWRYKQAKASGNPFKIC